MDRYILASQSPRRRELLHLVLNEYEVIPAQGEEIVRSTDPAEVVQELSLQKAMEVAKRVQPCDGDRMIVIGADTVVAVDGVCCVEKAREIRHFSFSEETAVDVFPMNRGEIEGYISLKEPYDKAGAYGIQGAFSIFIRGIRGDYNNVVGLPAARLYHELAEHDLL